MIDQPSTLATLNKFVDGLEEALAAFYDGVSQTPVGYTFSGERWSAINDLIKQWQKTLDDCIQTGLADTVNGFFYDRRYAESVTATVNVHLRCIFNVLKMHSELGVRYKSARLEAPSIDLWTIFPYLSKFGDARSRKYIGKLAGYLPSPLLQLYQDDRAERRRRTGLWLFGLSALTVATTFVLSKILGQQDRPALAIVCALGMGGAAAGVLGLVTAKLSAARSTFFKAGSGIAVTAFFLAFPFIVEDKFQVQFVLRRPDHSPILRQLEPGLTVGSTGYIALHPHDSIYYQFDRIPARYKNTQAHFFLDVKTKWVFPNGKKDSTFILTGDDLQTISVMLVRDVATLTVHGKLAVAAPTRFDVTNFPALSGNTDSAGNFTFRLPDSFEGNDVLVSYQNKQGGREERTMPVDKVYKPMVPGQAEHH